MQNTLPPAKTLENGATLTWITRDLVEVELEGRKIGRVQTSRGFFYLPNGRRCCTQRKAVEALVQIARNIILA